MNENNEKIQTDGIAVENKFVKWLDNFWYHYKWHTIFTAFFVFVFGVCFVQCATTERSDAIVIYAGGYTLSAGEAEEIGKLMTTMMPKNEDGTSNIAAVNHFSIYTEEELKSKYTDPETGEYSSSGYWSAKAVNDDHIKGYSNFVMTGESAVWLVSPYVYDELVQENRLMPLADIGVQSEFAENEYAIRLGDTDFYQYYEIMQLLPEDTLLVFARQSFAGATADEDTYALHKQLFTNLVNFSAK